ncbi:Fic family protein [uncultured Thiodictyon sp.]|uniref:Fic family protein n=1 Tax=uncultured Thiodictyon sp. TaxID=1846217 RepID=UPI0025F2C235|nr:Fic family protein [uncultured Thiodictyon sp.]
MSPYRPPLTITPEILALVEQIGETLGRWSVTAEPDLPLHLRRDNRIRTIHASLAIENNSLSLEQVSAILDGKRVLGLPREIQEVRNAFAAFDHLPGWSPTSLDDLLAAHAILMGGLMDDAGRFRTGGVGIYRGETLIHMAPPASRVATLMQDLLAWLARGELHPLVASCVFHYEFEFIHPFADGNGRLGRFWQTRILSAWRPILAFLPVETVVHDRQDDYYQSLAEADQCAESTPFVAFMLQALLTAMAQAVVADLPTDQVTDQASDQASDQVRQLLAVFRGDESLKTSQLLERLGLQHRPTFRKNYLGPALAGGWISMTQPEAPSSPTQKYRLTALGLKVSGVV